MFLRAVLLLAVATGAQSAPWKPPNFPPPTNDGFMSLKKWWWNTRGGPHSRGWDDDPARTVKLMRRKFGASEGDLYRFIQVVREHARHHRWREGQYQYSFCQFYQAAVQRVLDYLADREPDPEFAAEVRAIYAEHNPAKLSASPDFLDSLLRKWSSRQQELLQTLRAKYQPLGAVSASADEAPPVDGASGSSSDVEAGKEAEAEKVEASDAPACKADEQTGSDDADNADSGGDGDASDAASDGDDASACGGDSNSNGSGGDERDPAAGGVDDEDDHVPSRLWNTTAAVGAEGTGDPLDLLEGERRDDTEADQQYVWNSSASRRSIQRAIRAHRPVNASAPGDEETQEQGAGPEGEHSSMYSALLASMSRASWS